MGNDVLEAIYADQRRELDFRRSREQQVFTWSATVILAIAGAALASASATQTIARLGTTGRVVAVVAVLAFAGYSAGWQLRQRSRMRAHQRVLACIAERRGWFEERTFDGQGALLPESWASWGSQAALSRIGGKVVATVVLGVVAAGTIWLASGLP